LPNPIAGFVDAHYLREPGGLLVAGANLSAVDPAGEAEVDVLVAGGYAATVSAGLRARVDGAEVASGVLWLDNGRRRVSWSGGPGSIRLAVLPCAAAHRAEEPWLSKNRSTRP
jgi:hypothetical protein